MKNLLVLTSAVLFCFAGITRDISAPWLLTSESRLDCQKINFGISNARVILNNGQKMSVPINSIRSYSVDGKEYTRLPLFRNNEPTGHMVFMELVKTMGELNLYRIKLNDIVASDLKDKIYQYFLYKGDKFHLALDERSLPNVCLAFGLTYSYM